REGGSAVVWAGGGLAAGIGATDMLALLCAWAAPAARPRAAATRPVKRMRRAVMTYLSFQARAKGWRRAGDRASIGFDDAPARKLRPILALAGAARAVRPLEIARRAGGFPSRPPGTAMLYVVEDYGVSKAKAAKSRSAAFGHRLSLPPLSLPRSPDLHGRT